MYFAIAGTFKITSTQNIPQALSAKTCLPVHWFVITKDMEYRKKCPESGASPDGLVYEPSEAVDGLLYSV